ncbi:hypothetical protein [Clostridium sp. CF012]|uniref:hypothetical protein n=1 Tax=Clostridium sp. CF012 TaxID=2843319 RepID=UPI001C0DE77C|nr:hypothetical protein [Clostridium sp. CF012]MBU3146896.1 hypothetical protein [Clostridium sp. CF012]
MSYLIKVILVLWLTYLIMSKVVNPILFSKKNGVVVLGRKDNTVYTTISIKALIRYYKKGRYEEFRKDCEDFFNSLEKDKVYITHTHILILKEIEKRTEHIIYAKTKKKRMVLVKLIIGSTKNLFRKNQYYKVCFKI